tara:strand:+ start:741 stop:875 length:135 start_codon:yes stop_codon:yes gene_type:complete
MRSITTIEALEELYDAPLPGPLAKVQKALTQNIANGSGRRALWY